jgi:hypothetical protein
MRYKNSSFIVSSFIENSAKSKVLEQAWNYAFSQEKRLVSGTLQAEA